MEKNTVEVLLRIHGELIRDTPVTQASIKELVNLLVGTELKNYNYIKGWIQTGSIGSKSLINIHSGVMFMEHTTKDVTEVRLCAHGTSTPLKGCTYEDIKEKIQRAK